MTFLERASPVLKELLLKLYRADKSLEMDYHLYEFGSVEYHIQSSASDPKITYLSISTPLLSYEGLPPSGISSYTMEMVKGLCPAVVKIVEPAHEGYQLTLRLNLSNIPPGKESVKVIKEISMIQSLILSSQLKEILQNVNYQEEIQGTYKPVKLIYHPREPFFIIRQPPKIVAVFPMRFKENSDVIIATAFFQELMDVGSSDKWAKVPSCIWSPIPPAELRGEHFEDLNTNAGFVSFDIFARHVKGKRLDKTVWSLLNFYAYVKYHVKCTRGFIQRRMRNRLEALVEVLHKKSSEGEEHIKNDQGCGYMNLLSVSSRGRSLKCGCGNLTRTIKRIPFRIKIRGFGRFRRRWLKIPKFSSTTGYRKLN